MSAVAVHEALPERIGPANNLLVACAIVEGAQPNGLELEVKHFRNSLCG